MMSEHFGERFKKQLIDQHILNPQAIEGCTSEEIQAVISAQQVKRLPRVFREYMETLGKKGLGYNPYMGPSWGCGPMKFLKDWARNSIQKSETSFVLPTDAFVFYDKSEDVYLYFRTDNEDDNPPVHQYTVSTKAEVKLYDSLTAYFDQILRYYLEQKPTTAKTKQISRAGRLSSRLESRSGPPTPSRRDAFLKNLVNQIFGSAEKQDENDKDKDK